MKENESLIDYSKTTKDIMTDVFTGLQERINAFNMLIDQLETRKVYPNFSNQHLINLMTSIEEDLVKDEGLNAATVFKLLCEFTTSVKNVDIVIDMMFCAIHQGMIYSEPTDNTIFNWLVGIAKNIDTKRLPALIVELEKIGFERT